MLVISLYLHLAVLRKVEIKYWPLLAHRGVENQRVFNSTIGVCWGPLDFVSSYHVFGCDMVITTVLSCSHSCMSVAYSDLFFLDPKLLWFFTSAKRSETKEHRIIILFYYLNMSYIDVLLFNEEICEDSFNFFYLLLLFLKLKKKSCNERF